MNKSKRNAFVIVPMIAVVCLVGFRVNSIDTVRGTNANNLYTLTVNEISNLTNYTTGIYPVTTEDGNLIRIDSSGAK